MRYKCRNVEAREMIKEKNRNNVGTIKMKKTLQKEDTKAKEASE